MNTSAPVRVDELELPFLDVAAGHDHAERVALVAAAAERGWLARVPLGYAIVRYEDVGRIHRDRRFRNGTREMLTGVGITDERFLARRPNPFLRTEGDEHARLRRLVSSAMSPRAIEAMRPAMRTLLDELLDPLVPLGRTDLVAAVFDPFPIAVICHLIGAPRSDWRQFDAWTRDIFTAYSGKADQLDRIFAAHDELDQYVAELIGQRRASPRDDLLTALLSPGPEGDKASTEDLLSIVEAFLLAGTDTTRNQFGLSMSLLFQHPAQLAALASDPGLIPAAVEESLRYLPTAAGQPRVAEQDAEYRGVIFPRGALLFTNFLGANFDPAVFDHSQQFDIGRADAGRHLTFGAGRHFCLGAQLARVELAELVAALLSKLPGMRADGPPLFKPYSGMGMLGLERLDVTYQAGEEAA